MTTNAANLLDLLLEHAAPERIIIQLQTALREEARDRAAFREWLKPDVKAEFINGRIIMHSPAKRGHNQTVKFISSLLDRFADLHDAGEVAIEKALVGLERNDVEPDVCFWRTATAATFTDEMNVYPAPDLVVEVLSKSTKHRDRGVKMEAYALDGVTEYWLADPVKQTVEQYVLDDGSEEATYELRGTFSGEEQLASYLLPKFRIPARACFERAARGAALEGLGLGR